MVTVRATNASKKFNLRLKELHRVVNPGEIFTVSDDRYSYLHGNNRLGVKFVEKVTEDKVEIKTDTEESILETVETPVTEKNFSEESLSEEVLLEVSPEVKPKRKYTKKKKEVIPSGESEGCERQS